MWSEVFGLAWPQHGAFSAEQAVERGVSRSWISRRYQDGLLDRRAPAVYVIPQASATARQDVMVQVLAAGRGAMATGDSSLGLWCSELVMPPRPVVVAPRSCGYRSGDVDLWRSSDLGRAVPGVVDGIPTVGVARALLDASFGRDPVEVVRRIDACRRQLPLSVGALAHTLRTHARPGRPGIVAYRQAVLALTRTVPDSEFERLVLRDLVDAGVPEPRLHHLVRLPGEDPIELDLDWPGVLFDLELDGADHKERMRRARRDRQRDRLLQGAGYVVVRYVWDDYLADPAAMVAEIIGLLDRCRARAVTAAS